MTLYSILYKFLGQYTNPRTYQEYRRKLMVLVEFLIKEMQLTEDNYKTVLQQLDKNIFCKSVEFYVNVYHLRFQSPVRRYLSVVYSFFLDIDKNHGITNISFVNSTEYEKLKRSFEETIHTLNEGEDKEPLTPEEFENLRLYCDYILSHSNGKNNYLDFCSAIILKITMLFGLKSKEIDKLTVGSYDNSNNKIAINGYTLRLPDVLAQQLAAYIEIRKVIQPYSNKEPLFVSMTGTHLVSNKSKYWTMEEPLKHKKSECVAKRAIINMLLSGISSDMIVNLTGFSNLSCQECIDISKEDMDIGADNRYFDTHLRSMEVFDIL